ncbi:hypothetical protein [Kitasatospora sp. NPDC058397]|uniref:hypothetical protein n=1 Tax=unclassified Kitasatospora TaxID=2633591 RepID=UPI00364C4439
MSLFLERSKSAIATSIVALAPSQMPAWVTALAILAVLAYCVVKTVFPQDSPDRLEWWKERRKTHLTRRRPRWRTSCSYRESTRPAREAFAGVQVLEPATDVDVGVSVEVVSVLDREQIRVDRTIRRHLSGGDY